ncbi:MAG: hypothetical protein IIB76_01130 [Proteobacteria bacterium]|nr:hypothetical protein [Pseudomonadota bacterium]
MNVDEEAIYMRFNTNTYRYLGTVGSMSNIKYSTSRVLKTIPASKSAEQKEKRQILEDQLSDILHEDQVEGSVSKAGENQRSTLNFNEKSKPDHVFPTFPAPNKYDGGIF